MDQSAGKCPVCFTVQIKLTTHLATHSKEEIIQALSSQNASQEVAPHSQISTEVPAQNVVSEAQSYIRSPVSVECALSNVTNSVMGNPMLSYQTNLTVPPPLISGVKSSPRGINAPVPVISPFRPNFINTGQAPALSQLAAGPSNVPVLYKQPVLFNGDEGNGNSVILQNGGLNQNVFNVDNSILNQNSQQSEIPLNAPSHNINEPSSSSMKSTSDRPISITDQLRNPGSGSGQNQAVLCILPISPVQPSIPSGGNYVLYNNNNNILSGSNLISDAIQQPNVNYIIGANNQNLPVNNPQFPNSVYYLPPNLPPIGVKQEISSNVPSPNPSLYRPLKTLNNCSIANTSLNEVDNSTKLKADTSGNNSYEQRQSNLKSIGQLQGNINNCVVNKNSEVTTMQRTENLLEKSNNLGLNGNSSKGVMQSHKSANKDNVINDLTTIEVGSNIKISVPKDVLKKKERLKELINRELVRAILINDSDDPASDEEENDTKSKIITSEALDNEEDSKPVADFEATKETIEISKNGESNECKNQSIPSQSNCPNTSLFDFNNVHIESGVMATSSFKSIHQDSPPIISASSSSVQSLSSNLRSVRIPKSRRHSKFQDLPSSSHNLDTPFKTENDVSTPGGSGIKYKDEVHESDRVLSNSSLNLLSGERCLNFLGDDVFCDIGYEEEQVLGAVEEVFANENSINSVSLDCKNSDISFAKLPNSLSFDSPNISFESPSTSNVSVNEETHISAPKSTLMSTPKKSKGTRTYFKSKKSTSNPSSVGPVIKSKEYVKTQIAEPSIINKINNKFCETSEQTDEETVDDPNYSIEMASATGDVLENFSSKCLDIDEEHFSEDSKGTPSIYQGVPLKFENGESNGTLTEEVMSLKASETLADSDSERASPSEEMSELYYGRNCIFAGEPGPPNLSPPGFPSVEVSTVQPEQVERDREIHVNHSMMSFSFSLNAVREHAENPRDDTISLTLDANCSILPADNLHIPQLFTQGTSNYEGKEELWVKPSVTNWSKSQDDAKPFVTTGIVENYSSVSAHASTSGLQNNDGGTVKKNIRDEDEYDFEYESDCYGDSDSDVSHHRGPLDLEKWMCSKCNKTFKSLKEKLLHSGHHSPCSLNKKPNLEEADSEILRKKNKIPKVIPDSKEFSDVKEKVKRVKRGRKCKVKRGLKKMKQESPSEDSLGIPLDRSDITANGKSFNCSECSLSFPTIDKLYDHRATAFRSRNTCPVCHLEFKQRVFKVRHLKIHTLSDLKCSICHRSFNGYYAWSQHQLYHMGLVHHECKECGHKFQRKSELVIHYRKHSGARPYECDTCLKCFVSNNSLKRHMIVHMEGQEIECDICHKQYKNSLCLAKHKRKMHSKKKKYIKKRTDFMCNVCNEVFHSEKKLMWHRETHERWPKKCKLCGECFIHQANLTKHMRQKHDPNFIPQGGDKDTVFCTVCRKAYKRSSMSIHMRTHTGVKPYKCNVCNKEFTVKCNYLSHKWIHAGIRDRPFKCKLCERSFHLKRFLEVHMRSHKKIRPYTCNECGKSFIYKSNYQTHSKLHTEEKQHKCSYCGKKFFRKYNLNNHIRVHTGETPFECTICKKEFTQKSNYNVHMKAFHVERHAIHEEV